MPATTTISHPATLRLPNPLKKIFDLSGEVNRVFGILNARIEHAQQLATTWPAEQRSAASLRSGRGWSVERRARQSALMRQRQPWKKSTGPRTDAGKARASQNARKARVPSPTQTHRAAIRRNNARLLLARRVHRQYFVFLRREIKAFHQLMTKKPAPPADPSASTTAHTLNSSFAWLRAELKKCPAIENPELEARILLKHFIPHVTDAMLIASDEMPVSIEQYNSLLIAAASRIDMQEPLSRILGRREFWSLPFRVTPDVLDPRADTETLMEAVVNHFAGGLAPESVLDLGTGSGCILVALLTEFPAARGTGVDLSESALRIAAENAATNSVADRAEFIQSDWDEKLTARYPLIVANPPYIESGVIANLAKNVRDYDPRAALDGGIDGLDAYKRILDLLPERLTAGGVCFVEIGQGQRENINELAESRHLRVIESYRDLAGIERVLKITLGTK